MKALIYTVLLATISCSTWAQRGNQKAATFFEKGEDAFRKGNYKTALAHYNECLRLDAFYMEAYYSRAMVREKLGDAKGALTDYNIYLESKPKNSEALFTRGLLRYQYGQWAMAREDFMAILKSPPSETNTVFYATGKENGNAVTTMRSQGIKPMMYNYLAMVDTKMKNYKRATQYLDSAIQSNAKEQEFFINRAYAYQMLGDTTRSIADYQKALELNSDSGLARHNLAVLTAKKGDLKETERLLTEAIEKNPGMAFSYSERGFNRMEQKNYKGALSDYNEAIKLDPKDIDNWLNRAMIKEKLKDTNGAIADYAEAIKIKSDYEKVWLNRGNLMYKLNRLKEAIEDYTVAITYYPDYGNAYYNRALAHQKSANLKEACKDLLKAQALGIIVEKKVSQVICK